MLRGSWRLIETTLGRGGGEGLRESDGERQREGVKKRDRQRIGESLRERERERERETETGNGIQSYRRREGERQVFVD